MPHSEPNIALELTAHTIRFLLFLAPAPVGRSSPPALDAVHE